MDKELQFAKALQKVKELAKLSGNVISKAEIDEQFRALSMDDEQMKMVYDYLEKPVDDEELENVCGRLAERIRQEHMSEKQEEGTMRIELPTDFHNHQISCAVTFIKENYEKPIGLSDAAAYVRLSENHLSTLFKEVTGINFLQYLNGYRLNMATDMMRKEGVNISEIAPRCGFANPGYFAKIFKRYYGMTPTQFRDSL